MSSMAERQERGARELAVLLKHCRANIQNTESPTSPSTSSSIRTRRDQSHEFSVITRSKADESQTIKYGECETPTLADGDPRPVSFSHLIFRQRLPHCKTSCQCVCHSRSSDSPGRQKSLRLFNYIFGSLTMGYSGVPIPIVDCDVLKCHKPSRDSSMIIQYSFPTWMAYRLIIVLISAQLPTRHVTLATVRRVPYIPGNIFSRINSRDFFGALKLLKEGVAHVNDTETRHGNTVLGAALRHPASGPGFIHFIEYLLRDQVDRHILNDEGESSWHSASRMMLPNASVALISGEIKSQLHRLFPDPDWDEFQFTHLHSIIAGFRPLNLMEALENPAYRSQVNTSDALGQTPLGLAAMLGDSRAVKALLLAGADPHLHTMPSSSSNPLRRAVKSRNSRCVELLLIASRNLLAVDSRGATLLHTAAAGRDNLAVVQLLQLAGIPLDSQNSHDCNPLSFTPLRDNHEVAEYLISRGANLNNVDGDGDTPLTEAVRLNAHKCLRLFLKCGANYQTINNQGRSILHLAGAHADVETMRILMEGDLRGMDAQVRDGDGFLPIGRLLSRQEIPCCVAEAFDCLLKSVEAGAKVSGIRCDANRDEGHSSQAEWSGERKAEVLTPTSHYASFGSGCFLLLAGFLVLAVAYLLLVS